MAVASANYFFLRGEKMADTKLVLPSKEYEKQAAEYIQEFSEYNSEINGTGGLQRYDNYDEWLLKIARDMNLSISVQGRVPASTYFFIRISDNKIIGMINIRHKLNEFLSSEGGHLGYSIRPTERKKDYATLMLDLGLQKCKELNISNFLLTCDKTNVTSSKVIKKNNGVLENEIYSETFSQIIQRYWIDLPGEAPK